MVFLDPSQQSAAAADHAIQLVLAGPGAGKTQTLVGRFTHLVGRGVDPRRIMAVTFTKKAAEEMRGRIGQAIGLGSGADLRVYTFHALALRCLQRHPHHAGLQPGFEVWGVAQQRAVFFARRMFWNEDQDILDIIGGAKENLQDAGAFEAALTPDDRIGRAALPFFRVYEAAIRTAGAIDFADMVPLLLQAMADNPAYGRMIGTAVDHLLVDEYQDINPAQDRLIGHFMACGAHVWAVGDDDQTLYTFRAADVRHILDFKRRHPGAVVHILDRNYRSTPQIVQGARRLIARNRQRFEKNYEPACAEGGGIVIRGYGAADIEVRQVTRTIVHLLEQGTEPQQIVVLYRAGATGLAFQIALGTRNIPFEVRGAGDLWQGATARLFLGAMFYLLDGDDHRALDRMGTGRRAIQTRERLDALPATARRDFRAACPAVREIVATALPQRASDAERRDWSGVTDAIFMLAAVCASLDELLERIAAQSRSARTPSERAVVLSTVHSAKGLEWENVFVVGLEEGLMPSIGADLEEERRIAYVAVTRARLRLGLSYAKTRGGANPRRSRFIDEFAAGRSIETAPDDPGADERLVLAAPDDPPPPAIWAAETAARRAARGQARSAGQSVAQPRQWSRKDDRRLRFSFAAADNLREICRSVKRPAEDVLDRLVTLGLVASHEAARTQWPGPL